MDPIFGNPARAEPLDQIRQERRRPAQVEVRIETGDQALEQLGIDAPE